MHTGNATQNEVLFLALNSTTNFATIDYEVYILKIDFSINHFPKTLSVAELSNLLLFVKLNELNFQHFSQCLLKSRNLVAFSSLKTVIILSMLINCLALWLSSSSLLHLCYNKIPANYFDNAIYVDPIVCQTFE